MDFGNPIALFSGLVIGMVGFVLFMYGKKQQEPRPLVAGAVLCVYPYFVASALVMWLLFAVVLGGLYAMSRGE